MPANAPNETGALRVVIVDGSESFRQVVRELLECRGFDVVGEAGRAVVALDEIDRLDPDAVLLDVQLPDASGTAVATYLSIARPGISVLLMSAHDTEDTYPYLEQTGARGFVHKSELAAVDFGWYWRRPEQ